MANHMQQQSKAAPQQIDRTKQYISIFVMLGIITLAEVGAFYVEALESILVPIILGLTAVKFLLVVLYYMHLKSDHRVLSMFFAVGAIMAIAMFLIVPWIVIWQYA